MYVKIQFSAKNIESEMFRWYFRCVMAKEAVPDHGSETTEIKSR
jgi:hypothetical protein